MRYLDKLSEAKVDRGLTRAQKMVAREMRKDDTPDPLAKKNRTKADRERAIDKLKRDRENPGVARAATRAKNRERAKSLRMQRLANKITGDGDPNEKPKKKLKEARTPSTKNILKRRRKGREYRDAMHARIKAGLSIEPAKQTGRIPGPPPGEAAEKKLKAESYTMIGDILAEAISKAVMSSPSTRKKRLDRRMNVVSGRLKKVTGGDDHKYSMSAQKLTGDSEEMRTSKAKRVAGRLRTSANKIYKDAEVGEASGEDPESVAKKSARAHKRWKTAQDVENKP